MYNHNPAHQSLHTGVTRIPIVQVLEKTDGVETVSVGGHVRGVGGHNKSIHGVLLERFGVLPLLQLNRIK